MFFAASNQPWSLWLIGWHVYVPYVLQHADKICSCNWHISHKVLASVLEISFHKLLAILPELTMAHNSSHGHIYTYPYSKSYFKWILYIPRGHGVLSHLYPKKMGNIHWSCLTGPLGLTGRLALWPSQVFAFLAVFLATFLNQIKVATPR